MARQRSMRPSVKIAPALAGLLIAACGQAGGDLGAGTTSTTVAVSTTLEATTTTEAELAEESNLVDDAIADLAERVGVDPNAIEVVRARAVQWPDASLGCPEDGVVYTQAIVEGTQIILGVDDRVYDYHAGSDGVVFLCPSDEKDGGHDFVPPPGYDQ